MSCINGTIRGERILRAKIVMVVHTMVMLWWAVYLSYRLVCFPKSYSPFQIVDVATIIAFVVSNVAFEKNCRKHGALQVIRVLLFFVPILALLIGKPK